ncbi:MAG: hypothetical protein WAN14_14505 [Candidatus Acidiferrales bacterium]
MADRELMMFSVQLEREVLIEFRKLAKQKEMSLSALARLACKRLMADEGALPEHSPVTPREERESQL